jgi:hypothetical protein
MLDFKTQKMQGKCIQLKHCSNFPPSQTHQLKILLKLGEKGDENGMRTYDLATS